MFAVMLAKSAPADDDTISRLMDGNWYFDLKIDGVRCVAAINDGKVTLTNRNGVDITGRYPEIAQAFLDKFGKNTRLILDGECVVMDAEGKPSFKLTSKRDRQQKPGVIAGLARSMPATFVAFDVLYQGNEDVRKRPYKDRKDWLNAHLSRGVDTKANKRIIPNVGDMDGHRMLSLVRAHSLEGLVAKRLDSIYQAGRRSDWLKIKPTFTVSAIVTGFSAGTGARSSTFGALSLVLLDESGSQVPVGEVGTGFKQKDLLEIQDLLAQGQTLVVEVEYQEMTVDGALRFPVFRGIRTDITPDECLLTQTQTPVIEEIPV